VVTCAGGALAPGWSVRVRTRSVLLHGKERQQKDAFYNSPGGEVYNSRKKVAVAMGLMSADDNTCVPYMYFSGCIHTLSHNTAAASRSVQRWASCLPTATRALVLL
jgi:hypothetical protein